MRLTMAGRDRQQVKIVIAEDGARAAAERVYFAKYLQRFGPAVDEVADEPQAIARIRESDQVEELTELGVAPLNIADRVKRHGRRVTSRPIPCNRPPP